MNQGTEENVSNPFKFGGEFYDLEIGLYKQGLRFYDPKVGRWTQRDPLDQVTESRESNRYAFAAQDPVNLTDPSGADIFSIDLNVSVFNTEFGVDISSTGSGIFDIGFNPYTGAGLGASGKKGLSGSASLSFGQTQDGVQGGGCAVACYSAGDGSASAGVGVGPSAGYTYRDYAYNE